MQRYRIVHEPTGEVREVESTDLGKAITEQGWKIEDCRCEIMAIPPEKMSKVKGQASVSHRQESRAQEEVEEQAAAAEKSVEVAKVGDVQPPEVAAGIVEAVKPPEYVDEKSDKEPTKSVVGPPTVTEKKALKHKKLIEAMALEAEVMFIRMGQLLYQAREDGEWSILHHESFKEYVESLSLPMTNSYSWATRLTNIFEYLVKQRGLDEKLLAEIGVAKLTRLLPLARKGELTDEVIEAARILSDLDLREELGHDVGGGEEKEDWVICPRCGDTFNARKANRNN